MAEDQWTRQEREPVRLVSGMNDVMATLACVVFLWGVETVVAQASRSSYILAGALGAALAWGLSEVFSRRRRARLAGLVLCLWWIGSVGAGVADLLVRGMGGLGPALDLGTAEVMAGVASGWLGVKIAAAALCGTAAAALHWLRFQVPIAKLAELLGVGLAAAALAGSLDPEWVVTRAGWFALGGGVAATAWGVAWDRRVAPAGEDPRLGQDVAFWLHLGGAWLVVYAIFDMVGGWHGHWAAILCIYAVLVMVGLALDRRSLVAAGMVYFVIGVSGWIEKFLGFEDSGWEAAAAVVGASMILLTVGWERARRALVERVPWLAKPGEMAGEQEA